MFPAAICKSVRLTASAFCLLALLTGCASLVPQTIALRDAWPQGVATRVDLTEVPFFPQQDYQCGPAALATVLVAAQLRGILNAPYAARAAIAALAMMSKSLSAFARKPST